MPRIGDIADSLGVTSQTIRGWSKHFADFLSAGASPAKGETRNFEDDDVIILTTIAGLQTQGMTFDQIKEQLNQGIRIDNPVMDADQQLSTPVARAQMLERMEHLKSDNAALKSENEFLREQLIDMQRELGRLEGQLATGGADRVIELERKMAVLEYQIGQLKKGDDS